MPFLKWLHLGRVKKRLSWVCLEFCHYLFIFQFDVIFILFLETSIRHFMVYFCFSLFFFQHFIFPCPLWKVKGLFYLDLSLHQHHVSISHTLSCLFCLIAQSISLSSPFLLSISLLSPSLLLNPCDTVPGLLTLCWWEALPAALGSHGVELHMVLAKVSLLGPSAAFPRRKTGTFFLSLSPFHG